MKINVYDLKRNYRGESELVLRTRLEWMNEIKINFKDYKKDPYNHSYELYKLLADGFNMSQEDVENGYMLAFDSKGKLIGAFHCTTGTESSCTWDLRKDFIRLKLINAKYFLLSHNHPHIWGKGIKQSSINDRKMTERYIRVGRANGYELIDHLLIGRDGYGSMRKSSSTFEEWRYE